MFPLGLICVAATCLSVQGMPMACLENEHCPAGSYCQQELSFCHKCLQCEDLKREMPYIPTSCVTSLTECGPCLKGLMEERNLSSDTVICTTPESWAEGLLPPYGWAAVIISLLLVALVLCIAAAYVLRNFKAYKLIAAIGTVEQSPGESMELSATAPPPPPYNTAVALPRAEAFAPSDESSAPFIQPAHSPRPEYRQTAAIQAACAFNRPTYAREDAMPPTYETVTRNNELNVAVPTVRNDVSTNNDNTGANASAPAMPEDLNAVGIAEIAKPARTTTFRDRQDSNNNSDEGRETGEPSSGCQPSFLAQNCSPFIINVIKNITTVNQHA